MAGEPLIGKHEVVALGPADRDDWLVDREAKGLSMKWANQKFGLLRHSGQPGFSLFGFAARRHKGSAS